jgi:N-acetylgalactosamine-N,N'-diacetylbacillosaminyl-diphospho-undecaprenol 4-alpha-N-acetylgalactosaminyltransferase
MTRYDKPDAPTAVLLLSATLSDGGAERVTSNLLQSFDRSVIEPSLCLLRDEIRYGLPGDIPLHRLGYQGLPTLPRTARRLRRLLETSRPDVLLSNANATNLLAGLALRTCRHRPAWAARVSNTPEYHDRGLRRLAARWTYPGADRFVVNSKGLLGGMQKVYPFTANRIDVIGNPMSFSEIESRSGEPFDLPARASGPLLVAAGRLSRQKRYDLMLRAVARVREREPVCLWICGDGPERQRLGTLAARLDLEAAVRFLGFLDNPYPVMRQADLFVMTSDHEGLPNALIEAQALGVAAVSTRCPYGPDEVIEDDVTGLLVPVGDVAAIAEAIASLLSQPDRRAEMGKAAPGLMRQRFDSVKLTRRWEALLLDLARRK